MKLVDEFLDILIIILHVWIIIKFIFGQSYVNAFLYTLLGCGWCAAFWIKHRK